VGDWRKYIGFALAGLGLLWVLHDIQPIELARRITIDRWQFVAAAIAADIASYIAQAFRWRVLLTPIGELPVKDAAQAIYTGLFSTRFFRCVQANWSEPGWRRACCVYASEPCFLRLRWSG